MKTQRGLDLSFYSSVTLALDGGGWSTLYPQERPKTHCTGGWVTLMFIIIIVVVVGTEAAECSYEMGFDSHQEQDIIIIIIASFSSQWKEDCNG